ncbi:MAG: RsmB/NOP family class I SAM-dependent RNA methyltransferase [Crenarchaeota archaeon]|nr:RsmB/NOP family class I SAM-dependent RNA methyltransferase [Thermoproteota archaeon]
MRPLNLSAVVNVLANVAYLLERKRISLDRAFTLTCRRIKCSTRNLSREDMFNIAHRFVSSYIFVRRVVEKLRGSYSHRMLARAFLYLRARELGLSIDSKLRKAVRRDLRGIERVAAEIEAEEPWHFLGYPKWFWDELAKVLPEDEVRRLLEAMNSRVVWLRINTLRIDVDKALRKLEEERVQYELDPRIPILVRVLRSPKPVRNISLFREGKAVIQDRASVLTVLALKPEPGMTIYDFAAAPGIKTSLIMQLTENRARVVAMDRSPRRLRNMRSLLRKYGVDVDRVDIALADSRAIAFSRRCDAALVDAPCSSSGAIPKDPAIKLLLRSPSIPAKMSTIQSAMLINALRYSDVITYATCSLFPAEGEEVIAKALEVGTHDLADPGIPASRGYRAYSFWSRVNRTYPHIDMCEGFFIARLER